MKSLGIFVIAGAVLVYFFGVVFVFGVAVLLVVLFLSNRGDIKKKIYRMESQYKPLEKFEVKPSDFQIKLKIIREKVKNFIRK
jgi:hypothetical protein